MDEKPKDRVTPVPIPEEMRVRIKRQEDKDRRTIVPEILVLLDEALERREKRDAQ